MLISSGLPSSKETTTLRLLFSPGNENASSSSSCFSQFPFGLGLCSFHPLRRNGRYAFKMRLCLQFIAVDSFRYLRITLSRWLLVDTFRMAEHPDGTLNRCLSERVLVVALTRFRSTKVRTESRGW